MTSAGNVGNGGPAGVPGANDSFFAAPDQMLSQILLTQAIGRADVFIDIVRGSSPQVERFRVSERPGLIHETWSVGPRMPDHAGLLGLIRDVAPEATGRALVVRFERGLRVDAILEALGPLQRAATTTRLFIELAPDIPGTGMRSASTVSRLEDEGFRLFAVDDYTHAWRAVRGQSGLGLQRNPAPLSVLYAIDDPGMVAVAAVVHSAHLGGAERTHLELVRGLQARGHLVHTILPDTSRRPLADALAAVGGTVSSHRCHWWVSLGRLVRGNRRPRARRT